MNSQRSCPKIEAEPLYNATACVRVSGRGHRSSYLARIGLAPNPVEGHGERLVRLAGQGTQRHAAGAKPAVTRGDERNAESRRERLTMGTSK